MHLPVLKEKVLEIFSPKSNENYIDCTIGEGGHSFSILEKTGPNGKILGIDLNKKILERVEKLAKEKGLEKRLILFEGSFSRLKEIVKKLNFQYVRGILFDLGLNDWLLRESGLGFTFLKDEPLIMRYDGKESLLCAKDILNNWPKEKIRKILFEYGQEKFAPEIATEIVKERKKKKIESTFQLVEIIERAVPSFYKRKKIHFATKTFQALRIAVNDELENLKKGLSESRDVLEKGGKIIVICYHSLEDKIVKNFFKAERSLKILTKKPITPSATEIVLNKRSRSAKLRAAEKI
jgi:16S rRNA (cytosine1402-N4)-methyltransferase